MRCDTFNQKIKLYVFWWKIISQRKSVFKVQRNGKMIIRMIGVSGHYTKRRGPAKRFSKLKIVMCLSLLMNLSWAFMQITDITATSFHFHGGLDKSTRNSVERSLGVLTKIYNFTPANWSIGLIGLPIEWHRTSQYFDVLSGPWTINNNLSSV